MNKLALVGLSVSMSLITLAGCFSQKGPGQADKDSASQQETMKPPENGVAFINGRMYVNGTPAPAPTSPSLGSPEPEVSPTDFVQVEIPETRSWGPSCQGHTPGSVCKVPLSGTLALWTRDKGQALFEAFENDSPKPAATRLAGGIDKGNTVLCPDPGCPFGGAYLDYKIGSDAMYVRFKVSILSESGQSMASMTTAARPIVRQ